MRRHPPTSLPASIAALLRRMLRPVVSRGAKAGRRASRAPLTVIGRLPAAKRLPAANDPDAC
jgi:hypothetical protein